MKTTTIELRQWHPILVAMFFLFATQGCTNKDNANKPDTESENSIAEFPSDNIKSAMELAADGKESDVGSDAFDRTTSDLPEPGADNQRSTSQGADIGSMRPGDALNESPGPGSPPAAGFPLAKNNEATNSRLPAGGVSLQSDLPPEDLVKFIGESDQWMAMIARGQAGEMTNEEANRRHMEVAMRKLKGSEQLADHPEATDAQKSIGLRGQVQALSHLAGNGDLASAKKLEVLAAKHVDSDDPQLAADSRIVMMGLGIEAVRNGQKNAPEKIATIVNQMVDSGNADVAAMMTMGEARAVLGTYGHTSEAAKVAEAIVTLFGKHSDPTIANMAKQLAGAARFDPGNQMIRLASTNGAIGTDDWAEAVHKLLDEWPDMQSVQAVLSWALQLEAFELNDHVDATFEILNDRFTKEDDPLRREIAIASEARERRSSVIGRTFDPDLPLTDGTRMQISDHHGKVVLMPLWAKTLPASLQVIPILMQMKAASPDRISIVGINVDPRETDVRGFEVEAGMNFKSYRSESSADQSMENPVAVQFGAVSMPFVVILDQNAKVVAVDFTGTKLNSTVQELLKTE